MERRNRSKMKRRCERPDFTTGKNPPICTGENARFPVLLVFCLGLSLLTAQAEVALAAQPATKPLPGQQIAQTISLITGVAISPLMGVGAVGAWEYFHAKTPEQQAKLHWFANPYFWVPALLLVAACFVKDTAGTALPAILKKPFDVAETIEHKISGLVATGAFVPIAAAIFSAHGNNDGASLSAAGFAAIDFSPFYNALMIPIAMVVFFIVCLASNTINIFILLSPFPVFDALLKLFRTAVIASVIVSSWFEPVDRRGLGARHHRLLLAHRRLVVPALALWPRVHLGFCHAPLQPFQAGSRREQGVFGPQN